MSLLSTLPAPKAPVGPQHAVPVAPAVTTLSVTTAEAPPYGRRHGFVPRKDADFGGGGAFPEIHVAQYPLGMGRPDASKGGKTLAVSIKEDGQVDYDAIVRQGANRSKIVHSDHKALVPKLDELDPKVCGAGPTAARNGTRGRAGRGVVAARGPTSQAMQHAHDGILALSNRATAPRALPPPPNKHPPHGGRCALSPTEPGAAGRG